MQPSPARVAAMRWTGRRSRRAPRSAEPSFRLILTPFLPPSSPPPSCSGHGLQRPEHDAAAGWHADGHAAAGRHAAGRHADGRRHAAALLSPVPYGHRGQVVRSLSASSSSRAWASGSTARDEVPRAQRPERERVAWRLTLLCVVSSVAYDRMHTITLTAVAPRNPLY